MPRAARAAPRAWLCLHRACTALTVTPKGPILILIKRVHVASDLIAPAGRPRRGRRDSELESLRATSNSLAIEKIDLDQNFVVRRNMASAHFSPSERRSWPADGGVTPLLPLAARVGLGVRSASVGRVGWVVVLRGPG